MVKINYAELAFDHIVEFSKDRTVFAAARHGDNHLRIFLIYADSGNVYTRNGKIDSWEELTRGEAEIIRNKVSESRDRIPTFRINGSHAD